MYSDYSIQSRRKEHIRILATNKNCIQERVSEWPKMYGGVCPLNITYNYVPK